MAVLGCQNEDGPTSAPAAAVARSGGAGAPVEEISGGAQESEGEGKMGWSGESGSEHGEETPWKWRVKSKIWRNCLFNRTVFKMQNSN